MVIDVRKCDMCGKVFDSRDPQHRTSSTVKGYNFFLGFVTVVVDGYRCQDVDLKEVCTLCRALLIDAVTRVVDSQKKEEGSNA